MSKTRDRIIETAIALFNERGTRAVSTNHIASACGISPGNLYYHFRNKEEIIRAIFEQMDAYGLERYAAITSRCPAGSPQALEQTFGMIQEYNWRYRFFKRELTSLIMNDPLLKERFQQTHREMLSLVRASNEQAVAMGAMRPLGKDEMTLFTEAVWLLALFWLNYLELGGEEVNEQNLSRGNEVLRLMMRPYLSENVSQN